MNDMARGDVEIAAPKPTDEFIQQCCEPLSELEAFISMDEVLAHLQREFLNAKASHERLVRENGADDAMAEVAADMMDSAWCAVQTRLMEVRSKRELMARAQNMMRASAKQAQEKKEQLEQKKALALYEKMQMMMHWKKVRKAIEKKKEQDKFPFFEIVFLFMIFKLIPSGIHSPQFTQNMQAA